MKMVTLPRNSVHQKVGLSRLFDAQVPQRPAVAVDTSAAAASRISPARSPAPVLALRYLLHAPGPFLSFLMGRGRHSEPSIE